MNYKNLLKNIAEYGHGVFVLPMISEQKNRYNLEKWVYRHDTEDGLVNTFVGGEADKEIKGHGDLKICVLTKKGIKHFEGNSSPTSAEFIPSLVDIALINSYMNENNLWTNFTYKPKMSVSLPNSETIGLISNSWYFSAPIDSIDKYLCTKWTKERFLSDPVLVERLAKTHSTSKETVTKILQNAITPKAFEFSRKFM